MLKNYLKIAVRHIQRNKLHATIHIAGLAIAFSVCTVLFLISYFHLSFDSFHKEKSRLYQTSRFENNAQGPQLTSNMPLPMAEALQTDIPEIEATIVVNRGRPENISYEDKDLNRVILRTNPDFFEVFNFPVLVGNAQMALSSIQNIALSESTAKDIFGEVNPIGKELKIGKTGAEDFYVVSAILKDVPKNSSIRFDAVARIESLAEYSTNKTNWGANSHTIFIKTSAESNRQLVERKLVPFTEKYYQEQLAQLKIEHPEKAKTSELLSLTLTNIEDVHFGGQGAPKSLIYAIMALGAFILLIACFNFVNLNIAQSFNRSRELGVRKTLGAYKKQLFLQFWGEAFLVYFVGFVIGIALTSQLIPAFNAQFGSGVEISTLLEPSFLGIMAGVFVGVTLIAGGYPALKMANFGLVEILRGKVSTQKPGLLRNSLLISQFAISTVLICTSIIAAQQLDFLKQKPIGFEREQVISIPVGNQNNGRKILDRMRNELASDPSIVSIAGSGGNLGRGRDRATSRSIMSFTYGDNQIQSDWLLGDFDFLKTLEISIAKGRDFNKNFATDTANNVIVTEGFVKAMAEPDPIGKYFGGEDETTGYRIVGVIPDFNVHSPSEQELPIAIHLSVNEAINYIFVKVQSQDPAEAMGRLEPIWKKVAEKTTFNASFLNENLQAWYEMERVITSIFGIASGIAVFLSCLGLFAISLMVIQLRIKEIGIRKVMGATVSGIVSMLSMQFLKLVSVGLLIALPLAWFAMEKWIQSYEYRIEISPFTFILIGVLVASVAVLTVSFHAIRAASINPVRSLRTE